MVFFKTQTGLDPTNWKCTGSSGPGPEGQAEYGVRFPQAHPKAENAAVLLHENLSPLPDRTTHCEMTSPAPAKMALLGERNRATPHSISCRPGARVHITASNTVIE